MRYFVLLTALLCWAIPATTYELPAPRAEMLRSTDWVAERLGQEKLVIVHVAEDRTQYDEAHVPGARFLPWSAVAQKRNGVIGMLPPTEELVETFQDLGIDADSTVVFYDEEGGFRAARAFLALDYLGASDNAALMDGHWPLWQRESHPVSDTPPPPGEPGSMQPSLRPFVIGVNMMQDVVWLNSSGHDTYHLFDARPSEQFRGTKPGDGIERAGHIPGAANVFWQETVKSMEEPVFRSVPDLLALYGLTDIRPHAAQIVTYCRTGGQGAHAYFTLRYLGFHPVLYDGSYIEWQSHPHLPVSQVE